jgi:hypothetical protein
MTKTTQLFALTLGLASFTAPVFAHDVDARASASDCAIAQRANLHMSAYDVNRDGHVTPYEVKRVKQEQAAQRREMVRRHEAAERARAHDQELERAAERARAPDQELARAAERARARDQELARARVASRDDHHFTAPAAYRW